MTHVIISEAYYKKQVIEQVTNVVESSCFIECRFENFESSEEGALVSSGDNFLHIEKTEFFRCSSKTKCAWVKKIMGNLTMKCCSLTECYGVNGNTNQLGTAMGTSECNTKLEEVTFYLCWKQISPHADNVFGISKGTADVKDLNCSHCISDDGGLVGNFYFVKEGASIRYVQGVQGIEFDVCEVWETDQTISYMNAINNSFTHEFFGIVRAVLTVEKGCFFLNNKNNDKGTVITIDCISDTYPKATTNVPLSTIYLEMKNCRKSARFSSKITYRSSFLCLHLLLIK